MLRCRDVKVAHESIQGHRVQSRNERSVGCFEQSAGPLQYYFSGRLRRFLPSAMPASSLRTFSTPFCARARNWFPPIFWTGGAETFPAAMYLCTVLPLLRVE